MLHQHGRVSYRALKRQFAIQDDYLNLSHYQSMDPNVNRGESQECLETCGDALPSDNQAPVFLLKPGKGALGLESRHHLFDRSTTRFLRLPDALGDLGPDATLPELLAQRFRII